MSSGEEEALTKAGQEPLEKDSVFDFLYYDHRRIASFISQLSRFGYMKQEVFTETSQGTRTAGTNIGPRLAALSGTAQIGESESSQRTYDPMWVHAINFLDALEEQNLVVRDVTKEGIGQLVYMSGAIQIVDLSVLRKFMASGSFHMIASRQQAGDPQANRKSRRAATSKMQHDSQDINAEGYKIAVDYIDAMPHTVQCLLTGDGFLSWGNVVEENLSTSNGDILLKHGIDVSGNWKVVGILDASPESDVPDVSQFENSFDVNAAVRRETAAGNPPVTALMRAMAPQARRLLGRPSNAFGVTPLLIFREVTVAV